jgi:hypothetical protein
MTAPPPPYELQRAYAFCTATRDTEGARQALAALLATFASTIDATSRVWANQFGPGDGALLDRLRMAGRMEIVPALSRYDEGNAAHVSFLVYALARIDSAIMLEAAKAAEKREPAPPLPFPAAAVTPAACQLTPTSK